MHEITRGVNQRGLQWSQRTTINYDALGKESVKLGIIIGYRDGCELN